MRIHALIASAIALTSCGYKVEKTDKRSKPEAATAAPAAQEADAVPSEDESLDKLNKEMSDPDFGLIAFDEENDGLGLVEDTGPDHDCNLPVMKVAPIYKNVRESYKGAVATTCVGFYNYTTCDGYGNCWPNIELYNYGCYEPVVRYRTVSRKTGGYKVVRATDAKGNELPDTEVKTWSKADCDTRRHQRSATIQGQLLRNPAYNAMSPEGAAKSVEQYLVATYHQSLISRSPDHKLPDLEETCALPISTFICPHYATAKTPSGLSKEHTANVKSTKRACEVLKTAAVSLALEGAADCKINGRVIDDNGSRISTPFSLLLRDAVAKTLEDLAKK